MGARLEATGASHQGAAACAIGSGGFSRALARLANDSVAALPDAAGAIASLTGMLNRCTRLVVVDRKPFSESHHIISFQTIAETKRILWLCR
jgi:hypothetical protein